MKKIILLLPLALMTMGNQQCDQPQTRELRRRVEMGALQAPAITLPEGGKFDFAFVANAQLYDVLRKTQSFSTATVEGVPNLEQMTQADRDAFNRCDDDVLSNEVDAMGKASRKTSIVATCMVKMPQAVIEGSINSFELTNAVGITVDLLKPAGVGFGFESKRATLNMSFNAMDPLVKNLNLAATTSKANRYETELNATINLGPFQIGPEAYFKSDLSGVVSKAMQNGINDLKNQMNLNTPWYAMVIKNCDQAIMIDAGGAADAGLMKGDILEVYNVKYDWSGEVCDSALQSRINHTGDPIAIAEVEIVGDTVSQAKILELKGPKIHPGARVYVRKLVEPAQPKNAQSRQLATQK